MLNAILNYVRIIVTSIFFFVSFAFTNLVFHFTTVASVAVFYFTNYVINGVTGYVRESDIYIIWVRSQNCGCLVIWFCYQLITKPGNKTAIVPWPDPYTYTWRRHANIASRYGARFLKDDSWTSGSPIYTHTQTTRTYTCIYLNHI